MSLRGIDILILAGGLGTRLRGVLGDTPKVLAAIDGRPYLDWALDWLKQQGAGHVVLSLGHLAGAVATWAGARPHAGLDLQWRVEPSPMGTAGAVRYCRDLLTSHQVLVMNGDSFIAADLSAFAAAHAASGAEAMLLCVHVPDAARYGVIDTDGAGRITAFREKDATRPGGGLVSAGVYMLSQAFLDRLMAMPGPSIEHDIFARLPPGTLAAHVIEGAFIDIGTPESLAEAATVFRRIAGRS